MSNGLSRVIEQKILDFENSNEEKKFKNDFEAFRVFNNELVVWGLDSVHAFEGGKDVEIDLKKKRKELYETYTDKSISFELFSLILKNLYGILISTPQWRGYASAYFGGLQETDILEDFSILIEPNNDFSKSQTMKNWGKSEQIKKKSKIESKELTSGKIKTYLHSCICNSLRAIGFFDRYPFNTIQTPDAYIVCENVSRSIHSWFEKNDSQKMEFSKEEAEICTHLESINEDERKSLVDFFNFCVAEDENGLSIIRKFDPCLRSHLNDCVIPSFKEGVKNPEKLFRKNQKGHVSSYSLHNRFYDYMFENKLLWDGEKTEECLILSHFYILEEYVNHNKHKPYANYPFVNNGAYQRFQYYFGNNYRKFSFECIGKEKVGDVKIDLVDNYNEKTSLEFINGKTAENIYLTPNNKQDDIEKFQICTKKKYHNGEYNPSSYFKNLKCWNIKGSCIYLFEFDRNETVWFIIKEPSIVYRNGNYFLRMNGTVVKEFDKTKEKIFLLNSSALPSRNNDRKKLSEEAKNKDRLKCVDGKSYRTLGVDLGLRRPYSYCCMESTIGSDSMRVVESGVCEQGQTQATKEMNEMYFHFKCDLKNIRGLMGITKSFADKNAKDFKLSNFQLTLMDKAKEYLKNKMKDIELSQEQKGRWEKFCSMANEDILEDTKKLLRSCKGSLVDIKTKKEWFVNIVFEYIRYRYADCKKMRQFFIHNNGECNGKFDNEFRWIDCIKSLRGVKSALSKFGTNDRLGISFNKMNKYFNGCKKNLLLQIASSVVKKAVELKCDFIILEDLTQETKLKTRDENSLTALWSPKMIQAAIENAAHWYGILVQTVSENCTSKVHFETGKFGYRKDQNLYYEDKNGNIQTVDADENAAKNIAYRFSSRHGNIVQVYIEGFFRKNKNDSQFGKRISGFLTKEFCTLEKAKKFFLKKFEDKTYYAYKHNGEWISKNKLIEIEEKIKSKVEDKFSNNSSGSVVLKMQ